MDINEMKLGELLKIADAFKGNTPEQSFEPNKGQKCVVRTYASGVHYGEVIAQNGRQCVLKNSRRLWKWFAVNGISLSEVAANGIDQSKSKVCQQLETITITDALEFIPASDAAQELIENAKVYTP